MQSTIPQTEGSISWNVSKFVDTKSRAKDIPQATIGVNPGPESKDPKVQAENAPSPRRLIPGLHTGPSRGRDKVMGFAIDELDILFEL